MISFGMIDIQTQLKTFSNL